MKSRTKQKIKRRLTKGVSIGILTLNVVMFSIGVITLNPLLIALNGMGTAGSIAVLRNRRIN